MTLTDKTSLKLLLEEQSLISILDLRKLREELQSYSLMKQDSETSLIIQTSR